MGVYRICRTGQPRRYAGADSGTGAFLPENEDSFPRYSRYDGSGCSRSCRIYPTGQLDELGNHRHASDVPWAFIFERVDMQPRHPAQLYEALAYFLFFLIMMVIFRKKKENVRKGFYFGLCITLIFTFRFFVEFLKERQVDFENALPIDMGQILSIPFIVVGLYFVFRKKHSAHV